jgi:aldehyde:ferredoxin oxidoreductase
MLIPRKPTESRVLFADLSTGKFEVKIYGEDITRKFIGGYGLAAKILFDFQKPGVDPLGPDNHLGFFAGLCGGTPALVASRTMVIGKSPLTGGWGDANCGGYFGNTLKASGYDGIIVRGISEKPVCLIIDNDKPIIIDANSIWGKDTYETEHALKEQYGKEAQLLCIGPSGEKLSLISGISTDKGRFAARSGLGAVMGSKKLKAVVVKGTMEAPVADMEKLNAIRKEHFPKDKEFTKYGTAKEPSGYTESGEAPAKNWSESGSKVFQTAWKITGDEIIKFQKKKYTCYKCPIACGAMLEVPDGPFATLEDTHKPQYESLGSFGILCLIDDPAAMVRFNEICNRTGLDTISAGGTIAFTIECMENGIITTDDTDGLELKWGDARAALALTEMIAYRKGFGDILADGVRIASMKIGKGSEKFAIHIGGQEVAMHDPKNTNGLTLSYLLDATPGRHSTGGELLTPPGFDVKKQQKGVYTGRAESHQKLVNLYHVSNGAGNCMLAYFFVSAQTIPQFISAVTGWDFDMKECMKTGERIQLIRHAFNLREGINPLNNLNNISDRIFGKVQLNDGPNKEITIDIETMLNEYFEYAEWDPVSTIPSRSKLLSLDLHEVAETFYK